jgi:hypothetical protein|tara:strand:- start:3890 stop:4585 length:696 start_codon:yes stop_codon:yes gene_type:complete
MRTEPKVKKERTDKKYKHSMMMKYLTRPKVKKGWEYESWNGRTKPDEKKTYPYDTAKGIDFATKILNEEATNPKQIKDNEILNKEMKLSVLKDEVGGLKKFDNFDPSSYPSDPEQRRRLKNIAELEKSLGYVQQENNIPYKKEEKFKKPKKNKVVDSSLNKPHALPKNMEQWLDKLDPQWWVLPEDPTPDPKEEAALKLQELKFKEILKKVEEAKTAKGLESLFRLNRGRG